VSAKRARCQVRLGRASYTLSVPLRPLLSNVNTQTNFSAQGFTSGWPIGVNSSVLRPDSFSRGVRCVGHPTQKPAVRIGVHPGLPPNVGPPSGVSSSLGADGGRQLAPPPMAGLFVEQEIGHERRPPRAHEAENNTRLGENGARVREAIPL
jgi:hypothetical protein